MKNMHFFVQRFFLFCSCFLLIVWLLLCDLKAHQHHIAINVSANPFLLCFVVAELWQMFMQSKYWEHKEDISQTRSYLRCRKCNFYFTPTHWRRYTKPECTWSGKVMKIFLFSSSSLYHAKCIKEHLFQCALELQFMLDIHDLIGFPIIIQ